MANKSLMIRVLLLIGLIAVSMVANAQSASDQVDLSNVVASEDDYGQGLINFVTFGGFDAPTDTSQQSLLSTISRFLCTIALFMMAALSVVGGLTYLLQTANKGVPGGQVVSSFWMPLRICVSTILLIPLASGYSTIQIKGVYNIASTGNAFGGKLANYGAEYIIQNGVYRAPLMASPREVINGMVASELCKIRTNSALRKQVIELVIRDTPTGQVFDYTKINNSIINRGANQPNYCGSVVFTVPLSKDLDPNKINSSTNASLDFEEKVYLALGNSGPAIIQSWMSGAQSIAQKVAFDEASLAALQDQGNMSFSSEAAKEKAMIAQASAELISLYSKAEQQLQSEVARLVSTTRGSQTESGKPKWKEELERYGWTYLGMIYWQSTKNTELVNQVASSLSFKYAQPTADAEFEGDERNETLQVRYRDLINTVNAASYASNSSERFLDLGGVEDSGNSGDGYFKRWMAKLTQSMMIGMTTDDDADFVSQMQTTGNYVGSFVDLSFHAIIMAKATAHGLARGFQFTAEKISDTASGIPILGSVIGAFTGAAAGIAVGFAEFTKVLATEYFDLIFKILGPLLFASFLLAIVLPSIPLFYWVMGVVSWILFYIECLLISPIWLAAHGTAEKEGWGTEHTRQGYMLMIGLFLNPILRCAGFFAVLVVLMPLSVLIKWFSSYIVGVISTGGVTSPIMIVGSMLLLAFLAYAIANRVFSLPNELFEKGLRWVNGGQEVTGDENSATKINAMVANFGYKAEGGLRSTKTSPDKPANPQKLGQT